MSGALEQLRQIAQSPKTQLEWYLSSGKKVVAVAPPFVPQELIHSMSMVPMGVWGGNATLEKSKKYFPAFNCSIVQSILELGMRGDYDGVSALVIPSLCDTLKCLGQNWKYAVKDIPFIPMTWPNNRFDDAGKEFAKAGFRRVAKDLSQITGAQYNEESLKASIRIYNEHNSVMRKLASVLAKHPLPPRDRCAVYKSAWYMTKEEHTALVRQLLAELSELPPAKGIPVYASGYLADADGLLKAFEKHGIVIVGDNVTAESVQYQTDAPEDMDGLDSLAEKWAKTHGCSALYDPGKRHAAEVADGATSCGARGVIFLQVKFCDPDEFDYVEIKRACEKSGMPLIQIETDRQMTDYAQAETALEAFSEVLCV